MGVDVRAKFGGGVEVEVSGAQRQELGVLNKRVGLAQI